MCARLDHTGRMEQGHGLPSRETCICLEEPEDVGAAGAARAKHFGDARPGSATIIVKALVRPEWLIEIEAVAAAKV
jgi:enamine deaminase RidA (YjgF/YER057c/UK114 family)